MQPACQPDDECPYSYRRDLLAEAARAQLLTTVNVLPAIALEGPPPLCRLIAIVEQNDAPLVFTYLSF